jgi:hypothetical protein
VRIIAACHTFGGRESNKASKKILVESEGWLRAAEFLEFALREELKKASPLAKGRCPDAIRRAERARCPARFRKPRAGGSETRPAGPVAGLPGAGCTRSGSVVRHPEARDRTEPKPRGFGESRSGAPKGERALAQGARRTRLVRSALLWCGDSASHPFGARRVRAYRRSASLHFREAKFRAVPCRPLAKLGREQKAQRENENLFLPLPAARGEVERSEGEGASPRF